MEIKDFLFLVWHIRVSCSPSHLRHIDSSLSASIFGTCKVKCRIAVAFFAFIDWLIERCTVAGYVNANWRAAAGGAGQLGTLFALLANLQFTEGNERERGRRRVFCSRQALFLEHYAARSNYKMANRNNLFIDSLEGDAEPEDGAYA